MSEMRPLPALASMIAGFLLVTPVAQAGELVRLVSCPIYRDTDAGRKSGCWLADHRRTGVRYDVSLSPTKPLSDREILVEGIVTESGEEACGGTVLTPVRISVLPGACTEKMLPAEEYPGRPFELPPRNVRPMSTDRSIEGEIAERTFYLFFDFDRDFVVYQLSDYLLDQAISYIRAAEPSEIVVTGYGATDPVEISGDGMAESDEIAETRARKIARALVMMGIDEEIIRTKWKNGARPVDVPESDGLTYASRRRVEILVKP